MTVEMQGYSANFCVGPVGQGRAPVPINSSLQRFRTTKLKPRWDVHLRGDEDWLRRHRWSSPTCTWRAVRRRQLTSSICGFHLGFSLGSFEHRQCHNGINTAVRVLHGDGNAVGAPGFKVQLSRRHKLTRGRVHIEGGLFRAAQLVREVVAVRVPGRKS